MKKIVLIMGVCLLLVGCGSKKQTKSQDTDSKSEITLQIGSEDMTFKEDMITCGNYQGQSTITFNSDGNVSYEFYSCNDGNINLEMAEGTYTVDDLDIMVTNSYEENLSFEVKDNQTIILKDGSDIIRTFTK